MIFDPFPVKFLPQKKNCWFGPKIALFSVVNCPGAKIGVIKNFCCTKKWPRRGQKIRKKKIRKKIEEKLTYKFSVMYLQCLKGFVTQFVFTASETDFNA